MYTDFVENVKNSLIRDACYRLMYNSNHFASNFMSLDTGFDELKHWKTSLLLIGFSNHYPFKTIFLLLWFLFCIQP